MGEFGKSSRSPAICPGALRLTGAGKPLSKQFRRRRAVKTGPNVNVELPRAMLWAMPLAPCGRRLAETRVLRVDANIRSILTNIYLHLFQVEVSLS